MSWVVVGGAAAIGVTNIISTAIANKGAKDAAQMQADAAANAAAAQSGAATSAAGVQSEAAIKAAEIQAKSTADAIAEQQRQFAAMQEIMKPWIEQGNAQLSGLDQYQAAGSDALKQQRALMGLDGQEAQRAAISSLSGSAQIEALAQQGENALLQQGSATGGLRGGNIQGALAQFRPAMLSELINQQYSKLGGMIDMGQSITMNRAALGQASAAGVGSAGMQSASSIGNLLSQGGNAAASGIWNAGQANAQGISGAGNAAANAILNSGNAYAQSQLARSQNWANLAPQMIQAGLLAYGLRDPKTGQQTPSAIQATQASDTYNGVF
jgi:hypothetical protein